MSHQDSARTGKEHPDHFVMSGVIYFQQSGWLRDTIMCGTFTNVEKENSGSLGGKKISLLLFIKSVQPGGRSTKLFLGLVISGPLPSLRWSPTPGWEGGGEGKTLLSLTLLRQCWEDGSFTIWPSVLSNWKAPFS